MNIGDYFEIEFLKNKPENTILFKLQDKGIEAPADYIAITKSNCNYLLELKATDKQDFYLDLLKTHQIISLFTFEQFNKTNHKSYVFIYFVQKDLIGILDTKELKYIVSNNLKKYKIKRYVHISKIKDVLK